MRSARRPTLGLASLALLGALLDAGAARAAPADAAEAPPSALPADPVLARLIQESLAARPELARAKAVVRAEQERVPQAGALPDPMLQVGIQNDGFSSIEIGRMETSYVSFMASQTIPWPGRRALRRDAATLGAAEAGAQVLRARLATEADVRRAYLDLLLVRDRLALLGRLEAIWRQSAEVTRILNEAGKGTQSDVLRAELELRRLQQRRVALLGEETARLLFLNRLRAHPLGEPIETSTRIANLGAPASQAGRFSEERALAQSPELQAARVGVARAGKSVELAAKSYYPDVTVGTGLMVRGQLPPMWLVTVGAPIPLWAGDKQSRAVAEGRALEEAAHKDVATIEQLVRLRSEERRAAFATLLRTLEVYDRGLLVQSEATTESTLSQYSVGKVTFASVLEANAGLVGDHEGYLQAVAAAHRLLIDEVEVSLAPPALPSAGGASGGMPGAGATSSSMGAPSGSLAPGASGATTTGSAASGM